MIYSQHPIKSSSVCLDKAIKLRTFTADIISIFIRIPFYFDRILRKILVVMVQESFSRHYFIDSCIAAGFIELPLRSEHFLAENALSWSGICEEHKDPFDRLLLAQAKTDHLYLMTHDHMILLFQEKCVLSV